MGINIRWLFFSSILNLVAELAGELRDVYPDSVWFMPSMFGFLLLTDHLQKRITIVQADYLPLNETYSASFRQNVQKRWEKRNVTFVTSDRIDLNNINRDGQGKVITAKNRAIAADLIVSATCHGSEE